jgi:hypothetical protein
MRLPRHATTTTLAVLALIGGLACGAGTTSTAGGDPAAQNQGAGKEGIATVKVGEPITVKVLGSEYVVQVANLKTGVKSGNQFSQPTKGQFIVFDASVKVITGSAMAGPLNFKLITTDGTVYDWALAVDMKVDGKEVDQNWTTNLSAGQNKAGQVVLDVPADLTGARIFWEGFTEPAGYWTL